MQLPFTSINFGTCTLPEGRLVIEAILNASIKGWGEIEKNRVKYGYDIPFTILVDPTTACNKKCVGCWAADYNKALNLNYEELDKLFSQGKELGIYFYIMTGGEP